MFRFIRFTRNWKQTANGCVTTEYCASCYRPTASLRLYFQLLFVGLLLLFFDSIRGVRIIAEYTDPSQYTGVEIGRACGCGVNSFGDDNHLRMCEKGSQNALLQRLENLDEFLLMNTKVCYSIGRSCCAGCDCAVE